ncbi:MAG: ArsA family ATPase [Halodesulfurarchaeum sp.]
MTSRTFLDETGSRIVAFTGKGGVGKTTCSAATAIHFAERGERTILVSTDRSPSLSDVLQTDVYGEITDIEEVPGLAAIELDYDAIADRWKDRYGEEVYTVISSFVPVDRWVIEYIAEAPGIAMEFALSYLLDFYEDDTYDRIVWDTAPAGGTIGLIELEEKLYSHLGQAPRFYAKLRAAMNRDVTEDPNALLEDWRNLAKDCLEMIRAEDTSFVVVTIPEALGVHETDRIIETLRDRGISVTAVVANNVVTEDVCDCSYHRERSSMHASYLEELEDTYGQSPGLITVPQLPTEVAGIESLRTIESYLFSDTARHPDGMAMKGE